MEIMVTGRHWTVSDRFRQYVEDKLKRLERISSRIDRVEVTATKERNPRITDRAERVEITVLSKGPAIRAEASADDRFAAVDLALDKLLARLRKAADRKRVHQGSRRPKSVAQATAELPVPEPLGLAGSNGRASLATETSTATTTGTATDSGGEFGGEDLAEVNGRTKASVTSIAGIEVMGDGPMIVREKTHSASAMSLDQALYEMEMVGHDFFLFVDADSKLPSVVYRRRGYDYGVIRLETEF